MATLKTCLLEWQLECESSRQLGQPRPYIGEEGKRDAETEGFFID